MDGDIIGQPPLPAASTAWEDPPRRPLADTVPVLSVEGFEGPIDWLVEQVREGRIDLTRLSIAALVEAFAATLAAVLDGADRRPATLARWGAWLVMAADLTLLRSQLLVSSTPEAAQDAREAAEGLRRQVVHRAEAAGLADWLERREQLGRDVWGRGHSEAKGAGARVGDVTALFRACLPALRVPVEVEHALRIAAAPVWSVADALARIRTMLPEVGEGGAPMGCFLPDVSAGMPDYGLRCRAAVASTICAGLEMVRSGEVILTQEATLSGAVGFEVMVVHDGELASRQITVRRLLPNN